MPRPSSRPSATARAAFLIPGLFQPAACFLKNLPGIRGIPLIAPVAFSKNSIESESMPKSSNLFCLFFSLDSRVFLYLSLVTFPAALVGAETIFAPVLAPLAIPDPTVFMLSLQLLLSLTPPIPPASPTAPPTSPPAAPVIPVPPARP